MFFHYVPKHFNEFRLGSLSIQHFVSIVDFHFSYRVKVNTLQVEIFFVTSNKIEISINQLIIRSARLVTCEETTFVIRFNSFSLSKFVCYYLFGGPKSQSFEFYSVKVKVVL